MVIAIVPVVLTLLRMVTILITIRILAVGVQTIIAIEVLRWNGSGRRQDNINSNRNK